MVTNMIVTLSQMPNSALKEYQIKHLSMLMLQKLLMPDLIFDLF